MTAYLDILTGSAAGQRVILSRSEVTLGRDRNVDVQFDPQLDLAVSGRHASFFRKKGRWFVQDLGSLNGTLVNGQRIALPTPLHEGDRIQLGEEGPSLDFHSQRGGRAEAPARGARQGRRIHWALTVVLVCLLGASGVALFSWMEGRRYEDRLRAMQARIDSILDSSAAMADDLVGRNQALHDALTRSREELQTVQRDLDAARLEGDADQIDALRIQLQDAQAALTRQQLAAAIDFEAIESANGPAVAKVFVDFGDEVVTATAFAVRPDGTLLTNRHVVAGPSGVQRPERLAVQFAGSPQVWPARVALISREEDLAALKVDNLRGRVPTVVGFNQRTDTIATGQAVAVIGFPLGGVTPTTEGASGLARTTVTAGIIEAVSPERLDVRGYGVEGSSGSPVFDGAGAVIGVLFGGTADARQRTVYSVPAHRAAEFLSRVF